MKIVFWDFDGTLVYSNSLWSTSVYKSLMEFYGGSDVSFEDIRKYMAFGFTWHKPFNDYSALTGKKWWEFMNTHIYNSYLELGIEKRIAEKAANKVRCHILNAENYILYDDAVQTLQGLCEKGYTNAVLSNNYPELERTVNKLGLSEFFDNIIVSADYGYDKPRQELFDIAKDKYKNCSYIMVGDSVSADIKGGNNAGITTILVHGGFCPEADFCVSELSDILKIL